MGAWGKQENNYLTVKEGSGVAAIPTFVCAYIGVELYCSNSLKKKKKHPDKTPEKNTNLFSLTQNLKHSYIRTQST